MTTRLILLAIILAASGCVSDQTGLNKDKSNIDPASCTLWPTGAISEDVRIDSANMSETQIDVEARNSGPRRINITKIRLGNQTKASSKSLRSQEKETFSFSGNYPCKEINVNIEYDSSLEGLESSSTLNPISSDEVSNSEYMSQLIKNKSGKSNKLFAIRHEEPSKRGNIWVYEYTLYTVNEGKINYNLISGGPHRVDAGYALVDQIVEDSNEFKLAHEKGRRKYYRPKKTVLVNMDAALEYTNGSGYEERPKIDEHLFKPPLSNLAKIRNSTLLN